MNAFISVQPGRLQKSLLSSFQTFSGPQLPHVSRGLDAFPSTSIAVAEELVDTTSTAFEPILPETSTLIGFGCVVLLSIIAANVWANEVVPVSRQKLAISKRNGEVKEYLDELREASLSAANEESSNLDVKPNVGDGRDIERWLFSDWLNKNKQPKDPAIPFVLKKAKWNSGDNPVLVATAFIFAGVLAGSISDRLGSL